MGQSLEGFLQWKALLQLALQSSNAVAAHSALFATLLQALQAQLRLALQPDSFPQQQGCDSSSTAMGAMLVEGLIESSFLQPLIAGFKEGLAFGAPPDVQVRCVALVSEELLRDEVSAESFSFRQQKCLQEALDGVAEQLSRLLGWSFDAVGDDEYAPVVVET